MDMMLTWTPIPWQTAATASFTFWDDDAADEPWLIHDEPFRSNDRAIGDDRIEGFVRQQITTAFEKHARLEDVRDACQALADEGRVAIGPIWREVSCADAPTQAGIRVTINYYAAVDAVGVWFPESRVISVNDPSVTGASADQMLRARMDVVAGMAARAGELSAGIGIPLGQRFTLGGA